MPTWAWLGATVLGLAPECPVYIDSARVVHRLVTTTSRAVPLSLFTREQGKPGRAPPLQGRCTTIFSRDLVFGDLARTVTATLLWCLGFRPLGRSPPCPMPGNALFGDLTETALRGTTALFACVAINRGCGQPWPHSWHLKHLCTLWEMSKHNSLTCTLDFII
jgi:hypothetical protein